jgi:uncharacterized protein YqgV (UPF0045/DUF77 family)
MNVSAQVSVYPLRQERLSPAIDQALAVFRRHDLNVELGTMSTVVVGEQQAVFAGLQEAFEAAASSGDVVMAVTLSNACPCSEPETASS